MHHPRDKRVFDKEAVYLARSGFQVVHLCPGMPQEAGFEKEVEIITYKKPQGIWQRLMRLFRLYRLARKVNADVYHCNEMDSWFVGVFIRIFHDKLCVFDVHEHYPSTFSVQYFHKWAQPVVAASVRGVFGVLIPFTDRLVLANRSFLAEIHSTDGKKVLIENFTPLAGLNFADQRLAIGDDGWITLVHLGLFSKKRGWPQLLDALALIKNKRVRLEIIGEINDGSRPDFERRVGEIGMGDCVKIYDWMPFEAAFQRLLQADIGLIVFQPGFHNHVHAMPHKMFDYMAAGMAVVCPNFAVEIASIVEETGCGILVDSSNSKDIAEKLTALVNSPETIHAMGVRGQQAVKDLYNWEAEAKRLVAMYKDLEKNNKASLQDKAN